MTSAYSSAGLAAVRLQAAVTAGVIDAQTAEKLLPYLTANDVAGQTSVSADEEQLRLITGFNDIFVTIGLVLFLGALCYLLAEFGLALATVTAAVACWLLAEFFTRRKRMALPSIVLLLAFTGMVLTAAASLFAKTSQVNFIDAVADNGPALSLAALVAAAAAAVHWLRFKVPITVAAGCAALIIMILTALSSLSPDLISTHPAPVFLPLGLLTFAAAMWFDTTDRLRKTRRTDIAFWLHLLAAPLIVHPVIRSLGVTSGSEPVDALVIIALFLVLCLVALVVDRRALLVSSLGYLAYAAYSLLAATQWSAAASAIAVLTVGALVLMLSAAWRPLRKFAIGIMPAAVRLKVPEAA